MLVLDFIQVNDCIQRMEEYAEFVEERIEEVQNARSNLRGLSGMSESMEQLKLTQLQLEEDKRVLIQLSHTLEEIALYYKRCEQRIWECYEQGTIRYKKIEVKFQDLSRIRSYFTQLK